MLQGIKIGNGQSTDLPPAGLCRLETQLYTTSNLLFELHTALKPVSKPDSNTNNSLNAGGTEVTETLSPIGDQIDAINQHLCYLIRNLAV